MPRLLSLFLPLRWGELTSRMRNRLCLRRLTGRLAGSAIGAAQDFHARARRSFHYTEKRFWLLAPPSASASVAAVTAAELRLEIYDRNWRVGQIGQAGLPCGTEPIINRWAQERNCILHVNSVSRSRLPSAREMGMHKKENKI